MKANDMTMTTKRGRSDTNSAQTCFENYVNGNLSDAKNQARRLSVYAIAQAAREAGKPHHMAVLIASYLKHPTQQTWEYLCSHEAKV